MKMDHQGRIHEGIMSSVMEITGSPPITFRQSSEENAAAGSREAQGARAFLGFIYDLRYFPVQMRMYHENT
jgi:hypothetical protein